MNNGFFDGSIGSALSGQPEHIRGLSCSVTNCVYHDGNSFCTAKRVSIGPTYAQSCTDTVCATFKEANLKSQ